MKIQSLVEAVHQAGDVQRRAAKEREAGKRVEPERLDVFLNHIRDAGSLDEMKEYARKMAQWMALGGRERFLKGVEAAKNYEQLAKLAYNTALKGEGLGVKR